jgi:hypothetical protein
MAESQTELEKVPWFNLVIVGLTLRTRKDPYSSPHTLEHLWVELTKPSVGYT